MAKQKQRLALPVAAKPKKRGGGKSEENRGGEEHRAKISA